jgi:hypothetical protein
MTPIISLQRLSLLSVALVMVCLALCGCSKRSFMVDGFLDLAETGLPAFEQEEDLVLLAEAIPAHIKLLEMVLVSDPQNPDLLLLLSRLYGAYSFAILETEWERLAFAPSPGKSNSNELELLEMRMERYFAKGIESARAAMEARHPGAGALMNQPREVGIFFQSLGARDVPLLFWFGFNLGFYVQHKMDAIDVMAKAHLVEKAMKRVCELDPDYYFGHADVIMMVFHASRPPMMGGNLEVAEKHYRRHKQQWPNVSGLRELYWARYALVQQQKKEAFVRTMDALDTPLAGDHPLALLERVAAVRAGIYAQAVDMWFDE